MVHLIWKASIHALWICLLLPQRVDAQPQGIRLGSPRGSTTVARSTAQSPTIQSPTTSNRTAPPAAESTGNGAMVVGESSILLSEGQEVPLVGGPSPGRLGFPFDGGFHGQPGATPYTGCDALQGCATPAGNWLLDWSRADLLLGAVGFQSGGNFLDASPTADGESGGNFGFQQAFNFGSRLPSVLHGELGVQFGMRFTQTSLDGSRISGDQRNQLFLTTGLYRRVDCGLQGGLAIDYLHEDWLYQADLVQLRGELSWLFAPHQDVGFRFTDSQQTDETTAFTHTGLLPIRLASLNTYRFFYRHPIGDRGCGTAEWQVGFSEDSQALLGMQLRTPLSGELGLQTAANFLVPDGAAAYRDEGWNLGISLVWTPGRRFGTGRDYYRPLFDVADNGSLFITRK